MAEELVYNENLIIQFSTADFQAFALNDDDEVNQTFSVFGCSKKMD